jgi:hypothetical protein
MPRSPLGAEGRGFESLRSYHCMEQTRPSAASRHAGVCVGRKSLPFRLPQIQEFNSCRILKSSSRTGRSERSIFRARWPFRPSPVCSWGFDRGSTAIRADQVPSQLCGDAAQLDPVASAPSPCIVDRWRNASSAYTLDHASRKLARRMLRGEARADADSDGNFRTWIEGT